MVPVDVAIRAFVRALLGRCTEALALRAPFAGIDQLDEATALIFLTLMLEVTVRCREPAIAEVSIARMARLANRLDGACLVIYGRLLGDAARLLDCPGEAVAHLKVSRGRIRGHGNAVQPGPSARELRHSIAPERFEARPALESPETSDSLTEREREVAGLLAQGKNYRDDHARHRRKHRSSPQAHSQQAPLAIPSSGRPLGCPARRLCLKPGLEWGCSRPRACGASGTLHQARLVRSGNWPNQVRVIRGNQHCGSTA